MKKIFPVLLFVAFLITLKQSNGQVVTNNIQVDSLFKINDNCNLGDFIPSGDMCGARISNIGDLDGDGIPDLAVCASGDQDGGNSFAGAIYIVFMNKNGTAKSYQKISSTQGNLGISLPGGYRFGSSVCSIGDLNGDGVQDLAVGCCGANNFQGSIVILFMNKNGTVKKTATIDNSSGLKGLLNDGDVLGVDVCGIGDLNGDGIPDIIAGADHANPGGYTNIGEMFVLFLNTDGTVKSNQLITNSSGNLPFTLNNGDVFGNSIRNIGDIDGDGINDVIVGAIGDDGNAGAVYILRMNKNGTVKKTYNKISNQTPACLNQLQTNDGFGETSERVMDLNGDGIKDLIVGTDNDDDGGSGRGSLYVFYLDTAFNPKSFQKLSSNTQIEINDSISNGEAFGISIANIDTPNANFLTLAVGIPGDQGSGGVMVVVLSRIPAHIISLPSISLTTDTLCGSLSPVSVWIKNLSDTTLTNIPLTIILSGDTQITLHETVTNVSIAAGDSLLYNLKSSIPAFLDKTINEITVIANVPGNANAKDDTVKAKIYYIPVSANFSAPEVCLGAATQFNNLSKGGISAYSWNFGDGDTSNITNPSHLYANGGTYNVTLKITATGGCTGTITIPVKVDSIPQPSFIIKGGCEGDSVHFINTTNTAKFTLLTLGLPYRWNFGDGSTSDSLSPYHIYANPGSYPVTLKITDNFGCKDSVTTTDNIIATPLASFVALNDSTLQAGVAYGYQWFKNGQLLAGDTFSQLIITSGGNYAVEVTNAQGCSSLSPAITLKGQPITLFLPNAFTPNGDGIDDTFKAVGRGITNFQMLIYNRWGELVFQTANMNKGWDGFFQSLESPAGFYLYLVKYNGYETKEMIQKGTFWLLR